MARMLVLRPFLALVLFAAVGLAKDAKWEDYSPYWCTPLGRTLVTRGLTKEECQSHCGEGCGAVEWWEGGSRACYLCKDLSLLFFFPHVKDLSYPPHVFIKELGVKGTPTTVPTTTATEPRPTTSDEGIPTTTPQEKVTTFFIEETTISATTDDEFISSTPDPEETTSLSTEDKTSSQVYRQTTLPPDKPESMSTGSAEEAITTEPVKEQTTAEPEGQGTTPAAHDDEGTTSSSVEGTTASSSSPDQERTTASVDKERTTSSQDEESTTSSSVEETTASSSSPDQERITASVDQEGTTSSPDEEVTTSSSVEEGTTSSSVEEGTTSSSVEEGTTSSSVEEGTTSSSIEEGTTSSSVEEGTTSSSVEEGTTSSSVEEGTTSSSVEEGTTSSSVEEGTISSSVEEGTTSSSVEEGTTSSSVEEGTTSSSVEEGTTSSSVEGSTASSSSPDQERITASVDQEGTTSSSVEEGTTSSSVQEGTTPSSVEEGTTSSSIEGTPAPSSSPDQERTTSSVDEEETTSSSVEGTTAPSSSPDQERTTSSVDEEETTSSAVEGTTAPSSSPDQERTTSSVQVTTFTSEKITTTSATIQDASTNAATTTAPDNEVTTSVPEQQITVPTTDQVTTDIRDQQTTTFTPDQIDPTIPGITLPGVPLNVRTKAVSETEIEVTWDSPRQGSENIQFYQVKVIDVNEGLDDRFVRVSGDVHTLVVGSLTPDTEYNFIVLAGNKYGMGKESEGAFGETSLIAASEEPVVELSHSSDFVVAGMDKSTRAICFVRGQKFLGWFKSSGEQITGSNPSDRMFVEHEDGSYSLVIRRLSLSDGGEYVCRGTKTSANYSLYVEFSVDEPPDRQELWLNKQGEILLGVKVGYPVPEYLWKKDGVKFDTTAGRFSLQSDGSIVISSVTAEDAGDYTVRISQLNRRRETTKKIKVVVFDPPQIYSTRPSSRNLTYGYPARLDCSVTGIPKPEITWTGPDEKPITFSESRISLDSDGSLLISHAELSDIGPWTCQAINSVGTATRQIDIQAIYMPPQISELSNITANEGDNEVLNCTADGFPLPNVVWVKDNKEYPGQMKIPGESVISLESVGLEDISQFTCEASNDATDEEGEVIVKKASINVYVMVEPRPFDSDLIKEPVYSVLGNPVPVTLACAFTGYPPPEVWIVKNESVVATGIESVWTRFTTDSLDDYGIYYCVARNVVGRSKSNYTFDIRRAVAPKFTLEPKLPSRNPTAGFPVTLTWNVSGIPKPEVTWKSPSGENINSDNPRFLLSEGKLTIISLEEIDAGIWTLEATNALETTIAFVDFGTIYVRPQVVPIPDVVINEGDSVTLTCMASGNPIPNVRWIKEGKEYLGQEKSPGKSEISLKAVGIEDNSQFICEARNGAQDDEGNELFSEQSTKLIVIAEPRPVTSSLRAKPILSYIGNPKSAVFNCEYSGYPPPDVTIVKDDKVLMSSKESLSYSVTVDSWDDFGEYVCMAENDVGYSSQNYTFEITSSGAPGIPQDFTGEASCDSIILSWNHPKKDGGFPIINYVISYENITLVISMNSTDYIIDNLEHSTEYSIAIQARSEAAIGDEALVELKTTQFCKVSSCVNIVHDENMYTLNASQGRWPRDGFCRAVSAFTATKPDMYRISADFYVPGTKGPMLVNYVGVFFNAENENNFDFIFFRVGASGNPCFQTGEIQQGRLNWYESQMGSCPHGPPRKARWVHVALEVRKSDVSVFLEGVHVTSFKGHFPNKAVGGVLLANHHGNVVQFKNFVITDLPSLPFETKSCATLQANMRYYSVISQGDFWAQGFCRALLKDTQVEETPSYQVSVDLFSELGWSGDRVAYFGLMFNARDIDNADFIYFRPYWKDHCYQTGYIMGGVQRREGSKTGPCSCTVSGGKWFNVRLEIRRNMVSVFMNDMPAATFKSHYPSNNKGSGILVTGGCRKSIRFSNFTVTSLPLLPFASKNCQSARNAGEYYKLMAYPGIEDTMQPGVCRAVYPKVVKGNTYDISVSFYTQGSLLGGKYGVIFNVKNADSFEFVYFRPYNRDNCVQIGYLQGTKLSEGQGREPKSLTCAYGFMRGGSWYNVRVKVSGSEVKVLIDDLQVAVFKSYFTTVGRGGIMVASGFKRKISFKDYRVL